MRDAFKNIHWLAEIALFIKRKINKYVSKSLHVSSVGDQRRCSLSCQARRQIDFQSWMLLNLSAGPTVCLIYTAEYRIQINSLWRRKPVERLITCETRMTWLLCVWELTAFACWDWMCDIFLFEKTISQLRYAWIRQQRCAEWCFLVARIFLEDKEEGSVEVIIIYWVKPQLEESKSLKKNKIQHKLWNGLPTGKIPSGCAAWRAAPEIWTQDSQWLSKISPRSSGQKLKVNIH